MILDQMLPDSVYHLLVVLSIVQIVLLSLLFASNAFFLFLMLRRMRVQYLLDSIEEADAPVTFSNAQVLGLKFLQGFIKGFR